MGKYGSKNDITLYSKNKYDFNTVLYGAAEGGHFEIVKWAGLILGSFVGFAIVGYVTKNRIWKKIWKYHKEEKSQDLYKEQMKELPIGD